MKNIIITLVESFIILIILLAVFALLLQLLPESNNYYMNVNCFSKITAIGWPFVIGIIVENKANDIKKTAFYVFLIALVLLITACFIVPSSRIDGYTLLFLLLSYIAAAVGACVNNLFKDTLTKYIEKFAKH